MSTQTQEQITQNLESVAETVKNLRLQVESSSLENKEEFLEESRKYCKKLRDIVEDLDSFLQKFVPVQADIDEGNTPVAGTTLENPEENGLSKTEEEIRPKIKLVDINKLIDPKVELKENESSSNKPRKSVRFDASIVTISSSDEDSPKKTLSASNGQLTSCIKKSNRKHFNLENQRPSPKSKKKKFFQNDILEISSLSSSESSSDTDSDFVVSNKKERANRKKRLTKRLTRNSSSDSYNSKKDIKFNSKAYVRVLKVPAEKLKDLYEEKREVLDIKRLTDMNSLSKRKKTVKPSSGSDSDKPIAKKSKKSQEKIPKVKINMKNKDKPEISNVPDSSSDSETTKTDKVPGNEKNTEKDSMQVSDSETVAALCELENHSSSDEDLATIAKKKSEGKSKDKNEKSRKGKSKKSKKDGDSDASDIDNEKKKSGKKNWRKDKVLTEKLSSDSETEPKKNSKISKGPDLSSANKKTKTDKTPDNEKNAEKDLMQGSDSETVAALCDVDTHLSSDEDLATLAKKNSEGSEDKNEKSRKGKSKKLSKKDDDSDASDFDNKKKKASKKSRRKDKLSTENLSSDSETEPKKNSEKAKESDSNSTDKEKNVSNSKKDKSGNHLEKEDDDSATNSIAKSDSTHKNKSSKKSRKDKHSSESESEPIKTSKKTDSTDSDSDFAKFSEKRNKKLQRTLDKDRNGTKKDSDDENNKKGSGSSSDSDDNFGKFLKKKEDKKSKLKKKKIVVSDSDYEDKENDKEESSHHEKSSESSDNEEEEEKKPTRRRIKRLQNSSSDENDDKSTRKKIRNVISKDSLSKTTKQAEADERERKARISEKQKKYNQNYEVGKTLNAKVDEVVLDFDEKTKKALLAVSDHFVKKLKPHQASGAQFMWDSCFESLERAKKNKGSGCILAHCMGLGKTLQVIALSHTLLEHDEETGVRKVMVVCPVNTVLNWKDEFKNWLPGDENFEIFELTGAKQASEREYKCRQWHQCGGVLIIGYDMFRNLTNPDNKRVSKRLRNSFRTCLVDPGPDLVVCDEGHLLKNEKTNLSVAMNRVASLRRIVLTGTPLQNNMKEYYCMIQFVKPNLLGTYKEYLNRFVNPITNGQYTDSTERDIQIMRKRSHVLHKLLDGVVQRRDYSVLEPYLPPKLEFVLFLKLTDTQIRLYQHYMDHFARKPVGDSNRTSFLFKDFQQFQRICTHPRVLLDKSLEESAKRDLLDDDESDSEGSLRNFIDDEDEDSTSTNSSGDDGSEQSDDNKKSKKSSSRGSRAATRMTRGAAESARKKGEDIDLLKIEDDDLPKEWWQEYCDKGELNKIEHSTKLFLLFEILKECEQIGDKILLFSQSLYSLNVIEYFLNKIDEATQAGDTVSGFSGSWSHGLDYYRLDGSTSCDNRSAWCKSFNDPKNIRSRLFLISTRAGGLGINLVAANRVIIFDVSWNPSHDVQSIYRIYRFGQTKPCYIYRFVVYGTMEMKIYERQVTKQAISKRVIDEQQIDRHYNQNDLQELYNFEPDPLDRPIPLVPKDVLLGELLMKHEDKIFKYHEHQTLLENKEDEGLNEEERKAAWDEFENEKVLRTTSNTWTGMTSGMTLGGMSIHTINAALTSIIQADNPAWTPAQIKQIIPSLYNTLQFQLSTGETTMFTRISQEVMRMQRAYQEKINQQHQLQQALMNQNIQKMYQHQLLSAALQGSMPGSQQPSSDQAAGSSKVYEIND